MTLKCPLSILYLPQSIGLCYVQGDGYFIFVDKGEVLTTTTATTTTTIAPAADPDDVLLIASIAGGVSGLLFIGVLLIVTLTVCVSGFTSLSNPQCLSQFT